MSLSFHQNIYYIVMIKIETMKSQRNKEEDLTEFTLKAFSYRLATVTNTHLVRSNVFLCIFQVKMHQIPLYGHFLHT